MTRYLTEHMTNPANSELEIHVVDYPGAGNACHRYDIFGFDTRTNPSVIGPDGRPDELFRLPVIFQNGPIKECGVNGVTQEALLAIIIDRLRSFQAGPFSCRENALALTKCEEALMWLKKRTESRIVRNVEGTNQI